MREKLPQIKFSILALLLFLETFLLTKITTDFIQQHNYFNISWQFTAEIIGIMLLILYTFALSTAASQKVLPNLVNAVAFSGAIFLAVFKFNMLYALIVATLSVLIMTLDTYKTQRVKNMLLKFEPRYFLRVSSRGLLLLFSIFAGVLVILESTGLKTMNVGEKIAEVAEAPVKRVVSNQLESQVINMQTSGINLGDPAIQETLNKYGITSLPTNITPSLDSFDVDVKSIIETQVNDFIEPYKDLFRPVMAIMFFALFQAYASLAYFLYLLTIDLVFKIAKETGFVKIEKITVEAERLKF